mmetsp:Transcript_10415/g.18732  ORF Transcript_10415/g.18732 Transcript_10415/m.18732 type:complete len:330 (-) Transcript_10415:53-1042(-)
MSGHDLIVVNTSAPPPVDAEVHEDCLALAPPAETVAPNISDHDAWLRDLDGLAASLRVRHAREAQVGLPHGTVRWRAAQQKFRMRARGFPADVEGASSLTDILHQREDFLVASLTRLFDEVGEQISALETVLTQHSSCLLAEVKDGASEKAVQHYRTRCQQLLSSTQRHCCQRERSLMLSAWYAWSDTIMYKVTADEPISSHVQRTRRIQELAASMVSRQRKRMCYAHCFSAWQEAYSSHSTNVGLPRAPQGMPSKDRVDLLSSALEQTVALLAPRDIALADTVGGLGQLLLDEWKNAAEAIGSAQALLHVCRAKQAAGDTSVVQVEPQ